MYNYNVNYPCIINHAIIKQAFQRYLKILRQAQYYHEGQQPNCLHPRILLLSTTILIHASLLNKYADQLGCQNVNPKYFQAFKSFIQNFANQDFSKTINHQLIMDDILQIVDSELFIDCLRPDIHSRRHTNHQKQENHEEVVLARSMYSFTLTPKQIKQSNKKPYNQSPTKSISESSDYFINQYDEIWQSIERAYREHNIDEAYSKSMQYIDKINKKAQIPADRKKLLEIIVFEYNEMISFYEQFDKTGWQFDKIEKGITLEYKVYEVEKMIAIRISGEFDIGLEQFLSILSEIDLMGDYVPFCYDCKELKIVSRNERIGTSKIFIPLLTDRETYFYAVGYDRQKVTGSIFLYSKTINQDYSFQQKYDFKVPKQSDFVRLEYKFFIVEYTPLTKQRAKIRLSSKIDMKMNYLPLFILNKSARIFAFDYFKNILNIAKNYKGSPWEKKVAERPDLYQFFAKKVNDYFGTS